MDHLGFRIAYIGTSFSGMQLQAGSSRTIQGELEEAFSTFFAKKLRVEFTSRTDSGVHAADQCILIRNGIENWLKLSNRQRLRILVSLNALLPKTIRIWKVFRLREKFHPKKSILWKEYHYRILNSPVEDPFLRETHWWVRAPLNPERLQAWMKSIEGRHDFASFAKSSGIDKKSTIRTLIRCSLSSQKFSNNPRACVMTFRFRGEGFLHHMVRNLVGSFVEWDRRGLAEAIDLPQILRSRDRRRAGILAPAQGLTLAKTMIPPAMMKPLFDTD